MVSIQVDEQTAKSLESAAAGAGISIAEYIKLLVSPTAPRSEKSWDAIEQEFITLSVDGSLPENFSRTDIYADHD